MSDVFSTVCLARFLLALLVLIVLIAGFSASAVESPGGLGRAFLLPSSSERSSRSAGPGRTKPQDFLSIDPPDAAESAYGDYVYTRKGSPVAMTAPEEPGTYAVRYHRGSSGYAVLATTELRGGRRRRVSPGARPGSMLEPFSRSLGKDRPMRGTTSASIQRERRIAPMASTSIFVPIPVEADGAGRAGAL